MTTLDMWALAIGLAMDCFTVSMTGGILMKRIRWPLVLRSAFLFGFFQTLMPAAGWFLGQRLNSRVEDFDHWIAFALLFFLGVKMIYDSVRPKKKDSKESGIDFSSLRVTLLLAVVTSLDSLAVGVSLGFVHTLTKEKIVETIGVIGLVSFLL